MKIWMKICIVCLSGALVWGLGYCGTLWPNIAQALNLFSAGTAMLCAGIVGWTPTKTT
jgi:hypothetical protein